MGSIQGYVERNTNDSLLGVLNKMGSIPLGLSGVLSLSLLGVLNKMGSIPLPLFS